MSEVKISAPAAHWRRRKAQVPLPANQAIRQGEISRAAFLSLGKDAAIAFLNTEDSELGGRPLALATASAAGARLVHARLARIAADDEGLSV